MAPSLFRWAAAVVGLAASVCAGTASAQPGYRICAVEYGVTGPNVGGGTIDGRRVGLTAKVANGANSTCNAKTNWMRNEFQARGVRSIVASSGVTRSDVNWSRASQQGPWTYSMWTCEGFSSHAILGGDRCYGMTTNHVYAYSHYMGATSSGYVGPTIQWYHS